MLKFIRLIVIFGILAIGGGILLFTGIRDKIEWDKPHAVLEDITEKDLYVGRVVEGEIYELWDEFAYTSEYDTTLGIKSNERTTDRYFALPLEYSFSGDNLMFVAVSSRKKDELKVFEVMEKETVDYYDNGIEYQEYTTTHFTGKVQRLGGEYLGFFREYVAYIMDVSESEASDYFVPYVLVSTSGAGGIVPLIIIGAVMTLVGLGGVAIVVIRRIITGR